MNDTTLCMGKRKYHKKDAITAMNFRLREGGVKLRVYKCKVCPYFHLTHVKEYKEDYKYDKRRI